MHRGRLRLTSDIPADPYVLALLDTRAYAMDLPTVSLDTFLADPTCESAREQARLAAESLILTGALVIKDSRATDESNDRFLDLLED